MSRLNLLFLGLVFASGLCGCLSLDPFLYTPDRVEAYHFEFDGGVPEERVEASQFTLVSVKEPNGISLSAITVKATVQPPTAYAIFFHGKGNTMEGEFGRVKRLANMGFDVLDFDYRGFGTSTDVAPTEDGVDEDSKTMLEWWVAQGVPRSQIFYYSHSFGTAVAAQRAMKDPTYLMVLESPFASLAEFKTDASSLDFPISFLARDTWDTKGRVSQLHIPLILIHGIEDRYVRPLFSQQIYDASPEAPADKKLILVPGADHDDSPTRMGAAFASVLTEWVARYRP